jgi:Protein of unknown function (DUF3667)
LSTAAPPDTLAAALCKNCGADLAGHFCATCGQRADVHVPSTVELFHEAMEGITHSDSRLWRSLKTLLIRPGELTLEFVRGRRVSYLPPFRLYLVLSVLFFVAASFFLPAAGFKDFAFDSKAGTPATATKAKSAEETCKNVHTDLGNQPETDQHLRRACEITVLDHGKSLMHFALGTMPKAMFLFLPLIAFFHMLLYWRPRHRYAVHLLFFLHAHAFAFSVGVLMLLLSFAAKSWPRLDAVTGYLMAAAICVIPAYTVAAIKRVFQRSWRNTLFKAAMLAIIYVMAIFATVLAVFIYSLMNM